MTTFAIKHIGLREVQSHLDRALDFCFLAILFLAPLLMGGRHPVGRLGYVALICLTLIFWTVRQAIDPNSRFRKSGAEWLVLLGLAVPLIQLVHLPQSWLVAIAPNLPHLLPAWFSGDSQSFSDSWAQLSLYPSATRGALVMYLAYAALFLLVVQRIKSLGDVERFLCWIALAAVSLAVLGIAQMLLSNGKFLWVYEHPSRNTLQIVKGPFANENHFAHFLALGIGPLVWWLWSHLQLRSVGQTDRHKKRSGHTSRERSASRFASSRRSPGSSFSSSASRPRDGRQRNAQMMLWFALPVIAVAGLMTFSRGGVIVLAIAATFVVTSYVVTKLFGRRSLLVAGGLGLIAIAALFIYGLDRLSGELESVTAGSVDQLDTNSARRTLWQADWKAFRDFAVLGTGVATHRDVYPTYYENDHSVEYTHAESGYVQILMESGAVGFCALFMAIGAVLLWGWRCLKNSSDKRVRAITLAILTGILASMMHSIWDFVWFIPACITLTLVQVACLCRLSQFCQSSHSINTATTANELKRDATTPATRRTNETKIRTRVPWVIAAATASFGSLQMVSCLLPSAGAAPHWERYASSVLTIKAGADPDDGQTSILTAIPDLEAACRLDPNDARINLKLAALYLHQFEVLQQTAPNPMTLDQIRQAATASRFASIEQQNQWLSAAVGENRNLLLKAHHFARRAARLSPLQGEAYVHLSKLAFLQGDDADTSHALMRQAVRVRPNHGGVLISAAVDAAQSGDLAGALDYFRRAFGQGATHQRRVIETLARDLPPDYFLNEFEPDLAGLRQLFRYYRGAKRRGDAEAIAGPYVQQLESSAATESKEAAARLWYEAHQAYDYLDDKQSTLICLQHAVELRPDDFGLRRTYAIKLAKCGSSETAIEQLRWCLRRKPNDPDLKRIMQRASREKIRESDVAQETEDGEIPWR